ncbi:MAG: hypothetical protein AAFY71_01990 [Bacteroidota bacterium]
MSIDTLKLRYCSQFLQTVIFDRSGAFIESCDSMTDTTLWAGQNIFEMFPVLASMKDPIQMLDQAAKPISLPMVEMSIGSLKGVFDFDIYVHPQDQDKRVWMFMNSTMVYRYLQEIQQERNVLRMELEDLKRGRSIQRR